jgi:hypothetical protein
MWPWLKHWRDWAISELWPMHRLRPQPQALHFSYEKAGLVLPGQPIPWNAEAVVVEAWLRLPPSAGRRKTDFSVRYLGHEPIPAEHLRRQDATDAYLVVFRVPPPGRVTQAELLFREKVLGRIDLPFLSREEFVEGLRLQMPTLFVRVGENTVACETFVTTQCRGLMAGAVITSPTSLVPLLDLDLQVEFRSEHGGPPVRVPARLCSSQLGGRQALVSVVLKQLPRRLGVWKATWMLADRALAEPMKVRGISQHRFRRSLRVSDTRFVVQAKPDGPMRVARPMPPVETAARIGPCFLVSSGEKGMAGLCRLQALIQVHGPAAPPIPTEHDVLITDGPTMLVPGTFSVADLATVTAFELRCKGRPLGALSLRPAPTASFTCEGGFKPTPEYSWSAAAEEEMNERLNRLLEGRNG